MEHERTHSGTFEITFVECYGCGVVVESFAISPHGRRIVAPMRCPDCSFANRGTMPTVPREIVIESEAA
jgi:hypothetical protein